MNPIQTDPNPKNDSITEPPEMTPVLALNAVIMVTRHWAGLQRIHRGEELQFFRPKL